MKCVIPEISWNNRDPVLSLDIQPKVDNFVRLATSGTDTHIVIWYINNDVNGAIQFEPVADLNKHQKAVNVVRWSPSGEFLASGDDESNIIVWKRRTDVDPPQLEPDSEEFKESWSIYKILRGHMDDVYDLSWSPDSTQLISGSVDNTAIVWNLVKTTKFILSPAHKGLVQGVAWDPLNKFYATLGSDRMCRVFDANTRKIISRSGKATLPFPESSPLHGQTVRLFHDDTLKSYFRRLTFSPDGNLLITPAGCVETEHCNRKIYMTYIYTRFNFKQPMLAIPSPDAFTVVVRCCPILFTHRADGPKPMIPLPYRMVIAIASQTSVQFFDTQQVQSFGAVTNIHYTRISDLSWSADGLILAVSSTDGFCSFISFKSGELGDVYIPEEKNEINKPNEIKIPAPKNIELSENENANDSWVQKNDIFEAMECDDVCDTQDIKLVLEDSQTEVSQSADIRLVLEESIEEKTNKVDDEIKDTAVSSINLLLNEGEHTIICPKMDLSSSKSEECTSVLKTLTKNHSEELMTDDLCSADGDVESEPQTNDAKLSEKQDVPKSNNEEHLKNGPKTPRRVNFVTLSSPRAKKL